MCGACLSVYTKRDEPTICFVGWAQTALDDAPMSTTNADEFIGQSNVAIGMEAKMPPIQHALRLKECSAGADPYTRPGRVSRYFFIMPRQSPSIVATHSHTNVNECRRIE